MTATAVDDREAMIRDVCAAADDGDGARFASYFSEYATVHAIWPARHRVDQVAEVGDQLFCRFTIVVQPPDAVELSLPCVTVVQVGHDGLITDYRVHMDIAPALRHGQ